MRDMFRQRARLGEYDFHADGRATISVFNFTKVGGQWRLSEIDFTDTDDFAHHVKGRCS